MNETITNELNPNRPIIQTPLLGRENSHVVYRDIKLSLFSHVSEWGLF